MTVIINSPLMIRRGLSSYVLKVAAGKSIHTMDGGNHLSVEVCISGHVHIICLKEALSALHYQ